MGRVRRFFRRIKDFTIEIRTVKKYYADSGEEVTRKNNGCKVEGFILNPEKDIELRKISSHGGSTGIVIPPSMLSCFNSGYLKIHKLTIFEDSEPILVLTSPDKTLMVGVEDK